MNHRTVRFLATLIFMTATSQASLPVYLRTAPAYHQQQRTEVGCASACMPTCQPTCMAQYNPVVPMAHFASAINQPAVLPNTVIHPSPALSLISPLYHVPSPYYIIPPCMNTCMPSCSSSCIEKTTQIPETTTTVILPEVTPPTVIVPETTTVGLTTTVGPTTTTLPPTTTTEVTTELPTTQTTTVPTIPSTVTEIEITPPPFTTTEVPFLPFPSTIPQADPTTTTESTVIGCQNICVVKIAAGIPLESVLERVMAKCPAIQCSCPPGYNPCGNKICCKH